MKQQSPLNQVRDKGYRDAVFYGIDVATFRDGNGDGIGDLQGVTDSLDYLAWLGVDVIWLLPFYTSPRGDNGYDVVDHCAVDPRFGTLDDFRTLVDEAAARGIRILIDLVLSHTSWHHPWFVDASLSADSPFHDYYIWRNNPASAAPREPVFPGPEKSVWKYVPAVRAYYLHHFYDFQPELNHENPAVQEEMFRVVDFWMEQGASAFRLDAAPFMGDDLDDEPPDPHALLKKIRARIREKDERVFLLAEADLDPELLHAYFGKNNDEAQLLFNFILNQHLFLAIAEGRVDGIDKSIEMTPPVPPTGQWAHYLRNNDELSLLRLTPDERKLVFDTYAPDESMRIYERGIRRRLSSMLDYDLARIALMFSLECSLPGAPLIMYGNEIGLGDDLNLPERYAVRIPMPWKHLSTLPGTDGQPVSTLLISDPDTDKVHEVEYEAHLAFEESEALVDAVRQMLALRKSCEPMTQGNFQRLDCRNAHVFANLWHREDDILVCVNNLSNQTQEIDLDDIRGDVVTELGSNDGIRSSGDRLHFSLEPYGYRWLRVGQLARTVADSRHGQQMVRSVS